MGLKLLQKKKKKKIKYYENLHVKARPNAFSEWGIKASVLLLMVGRNVRKLPEKTLTTQ